MNTIQFSYVKQNLVDSKQIVNLTPLNRDVSKTSLITYAFPLIPSGNYTGSVNISSNCYQTNAFIKNEMTYNVQTSKGNISFVFHINSQYLEPGTYICNAIYGDGIFAPNSSSAKLVVANDMFNLTTLTLSPYQLS